MMSRGDPGGRTGGRLTPSTPASSTSLNRPGAPSSSSARLASHGRNDLSSQRYLLNEPEDVLPLPGRTRKQYPDFFPWKKCKEEDALAVEYVQKGYSEPPAVSSECSSEKNSMIPLFKQWTSLPALQYFLFRSLEEREKNNRITTASTFKPPPRVTLTEQKREAWLKDLASPTVPLRRLSRTIPHGIRGRTLLEQCCNKMVPTSRAVWFIRCVGANELRGLKRRGANSSNITEAGWIHDWTEEVAEFIEKSIREFGKPDRETWRLRFEYMTRLLAHLYHEELVDHGQVLRWSLRYFQKCKPEELPIALVLVKMFWSQLIASRLLSQALAHALLTQYSNVSNLNGQVFSNLLASICDAMNKLFEISAESFVIPKQWRTLAPILTAAINNTPQAQDKLQTIRIRNESLIVSDAPLVRAHRDQKAVLVKELDKLRAPIDGAGFLAAIRPCKLEDEEVLRLIFQWSSTSDRPGREKVYVAFALCRYLSEQRGWDISEPFITFLSGMRGPQRLCLQNVHDLVHEFAQHDLFSLDRYMRVLTSSGVLFLEHLRSEIRPQIEVLRNLHLNDFLPGFEGYRALLLRGIDRRARDEDVEMQDADSSEENNLEKARDIISEACSFLLICGGGGGEGGGDDAVHDESAEGADLTIEGVTLLESLEKRSKVELSRWISSFNQVLSVSQFATIERILVALHGYQELYSVIGQQAQRVETGMQLYFLASSVKDKVQIFAAYEDLSDIIQSLVMRFRSLKLESAMSKGLYDLVQFALLDIKTIKPEVQSELEQIIRPAQASPLDISKLSPMSEAQVDGHAWSITSDITSILGVDLGLGPEHFDAKAVPKVFEVASAKFLEMCKSADNGIQCRRLVRVMQYMRDADLRTFNDLLIKLLRDQVEPDMYYDRVAFLRVILFLVIYECLTFDKIADIFQQLKSVRAPGAAAATRLMIDLITCEYFEQIPLKASEKISLDIQRRAFENQHGKVFLKFVGQNILESSSEQDLLLEFLNPCMTDFLLHECNRNTETVINVVIDPILEVGSNIKAVQALKLLFMRLISVQLTASPLEDISSIIKAVNVFNLPVAQLALRVYLKALQIEPKPASSTEILENAISPKIALDAAFTSAEVVGFVKHCAFDAGSLQICPKSLGDMMIHLHKNLKADILLQTELSFLKSDEFPRVDPERKGVNAVKTLYEIVDAVADCATENLCVHYAPEMIKCIDKLVELAEVKTANDDEIKDDNNFSSASTATDVKDAILLFMKIAMINCQSFTQDMLPLREKLVTGISMLLNSPLIAASTELSGLLVDGLSAFRGEISDGEVSTPANATPKISGVAMQAARSSPKLFLNSGVAASPSSTQVTSSILPHGVAKSSGVVTAVASATSSTPSQAFQHSDLSYLSGLMIYDPRSDSYSDVSVRSFDLLEDSTPTISLNDVPLNLSLFDCSIEKHNP